MSQGHSYILLAMLCSLLLQGPMRSCQNPAKPIVFNGEIAYLAGSGVGYNEGYATVAFEAAPVIGASSYFFLDGRGHVLNNSFLAANIGAGLRFWMDQNTTGLGLNLYYDLREAHTMLFQQLGIGGELLTPQGDVRINLYFPIGHPEDLVSTEHWNYAAGYYLHKYNRTVALSGFDVTWGSTMIETASVKLYGALGPYYIAHARWHRAVGGAGRLQVTYKHWLSLEFDLSSDSLFHTRFAAQISFRFPCNNKKTCCPLQVQRRELIALIYDPLWEWNW